MKRKRNCWYNVTCFHPGVMYDCKRRKWLTYEEIKGNSCSHSRFNTASRALKNAYALNTKFGCKVIIMQWFYYKGKRYCREYTLKAKV